MHNDEYYRENRIRITAEDEVAVQHRHHLNHSHSNQDVDSDQALHDDSFDEHEHSDYSLEHRWDVIDDDAEDENN
jgi:hypothetical protein